jgi:hypothetical protein
VQGLLRVQREEEAKGASAGAPMELLSAQHFMRLYLREPLPPVVASGAPFPVSLYLSNEFGLSRRGSHAGVALALEAIHAGDGRPHGGVALATDPVSPTLDDRGKCVVKVQMAVAPGTSADLLLVLRCGPGSGHVVPVVSTPVHVVGEGAAAPKDPAPQWLGHNCRVFDMPGGAPPVFLLELLGACVGGGGGTTGLGRAFGNACLHMHFAWCATSTRVAPIRPHPLPLYLPTHPLPCCPLHT